MWAWFLCSPPTRQSGQSNKTLTAQHCLYTATHLELSKSTRLWGENSRSPPSNPKEQTKISLTWSGTLTWRECAKRQVQLKHHLRPILAASNLCHSLNKLTLRLIIKLTACLTSGCRKYLSANFDGHDFHFYGFLLSPSVLDQNVSLISDILPI